MLPTPVHIRAPVPGSRMPMGNLRGLILLLMLAPLLLHAQPPEEDGRDVPLIASISGADSAEIRPPWEDYAVVALRLDLMATPGGGSFFDSYPLLFGRERELDVSVSPGIGVRGRVTDRLRWTAFGSYTWTGFSEVYDGLRFPSDNGSGQRLDTLLPAAQIQEDMSLRGFILLGGLEYSPVSSQFSSYVGLAGGAGFIGTSWFSTVRTFGSLVYHRPRINVDDTRVSPAVRLYSGVDLRFDYAEMNRSVVRGVFIEASWLWLPVTAEYFGPIRDVSENLPVLPQQRSATLDIGGFALGIGVNLQLIPEE